MKMIQDFKGDINNSLKEIQESTDKQVEALKEKTHIPLSEIQENTIKRVKELNKNVQDKIWKQQQERYHNGRQPW